MKCNLCAPTGKLWPVGICSKVILYSKSHISISFPSRLWPDLKVPTETAHTHTHTLTNMHVKQNPEYHTRTHAFKSKLGFSPLTRFHLFDLFKKATNNRINCWLTVNNSSLHVYQGWWLVYTQTDAKQKKSTKCVAARQLFIPAVTSGIKKIFLPLCINSVTSESLRELTPPPRPNTPSPVWETCFVTSLMFITRKNEKIHILIINLQVL